MVCWVDIMSLNVPYIHLLGRELTLEEVLAALCCIQREAAYRAHGGKRGKYCCGLNASMGVIILTRLQATVCRVRIGVRRSVHLAVITVRRRMPTATRLSIA